MMACRMHARKPAVHAPPGQAAHGAGAQYYEGWGSMVPVKQVALPSYGWIARCTALVSTGRFKTLGIGDMQEAVDKPQGVPLSEWCACKAVEFHNAPSQMVGLLKGHYCTEHRCRTMQGRERQWMWDGKEVPA